jgi:hypothetical protein
VYIHPSTLSCQQLDSVFSIATSRHAAIPTRSFVPLLPMETGKIRQQHPNELHYETKAVE